MLRVSLRTRLLTLVPLVVVLALASFLRFWNLGAAEFKYDEARLCTLAADLVDTGILPLRGMGSSTGIDNPPLSVYLMAVPILLGHDPLIATAFVALLNVVAVLGCYGLGQRYWGRGVGLVAATLLAVSPWAVFYSRKVWAQNLLLPGTILFFAFLLAWLVESKRWALSGAIVTLAALTQIHFAALAFVPLLLLILAVVGLDHAVQRRARTLWAPVIAGVAAGLLLYVPYLAFDAAHGWVNMRALVGLLQRPVQTHLEALRFALLNIGGREIHSLAGPQEYRNFLGSILDLSYWPDRLEEGLAVVSLTYLVLRCVLGPRRNPRWRQESVLSLWLVVPVGFFLRQRSAVFPHYLLPLYPAPYLALAMSVVDILRVATRTRRPRQVLQSSVNGAGVPAPTPSADTADGATRCPTSTTPSDERRSSAGRVTSRPWIYVLAGSLLAMLAAWQSYLSLSINSFVGQHDTPGGMGTPIRIYEDVFSAMTRYATAWQNRQVVVLCAGDDPRLDECPAVFGFVAGRALDVRFVDRDSALLFPAGTRDTLAVLAPGASRVAIEIPRYAQELPEASVSLRERTGYYRFYRLSDAYMPAPAVSPNGAPVYLANGTAVLGYDLPSLVADQPAQLALFWRVDAMPTEPPAQGYSFANHLLAADGQSFAQKDGPGYPVRLWRPGDTVISWFDLPLPVDLPAGPYRLQISVYVYTPPDEFTPIPVLGVDGQPGGSTTTWPLP